MPPPFARGYCLRKLDHISVVPVLTLQYYVVPAGFADLRPQRHLAHPMPYLREYLWSLTFLQQAAAVFHPFHTNIIIAIQNHLAIHSHMRYLAHKILIATSFLRPMSIHIQILIAPAFLHLKSRFSLVLHSLTSRISLALHSCVP